jgi:hypothetical protein
MEEEYNELKRLGFLNRQPTLWRHGCPSILIEPTDDDDDNTIRMGPLTLAPMNADFDYNSVDF